MGGGAQEKNGNKTSHKFTTAWDMTGVQIDKTIKNLTITSIAFEKMEDGTEVTVYHVGKFEGKFNLKNLLMNTMCDNLNLTAKIALVVAVIKGTELIQFEEMVNNYLTLYQYCRSKTVVPSGEVMTDFKEDTRINFTTVEVEDLFKIFENVNTKLAIIVICRLCEMTKTMMANYKGKNKRWSKSIDGEPCSLTIYFPRDNDSKVTPKTPTISRFMSFFGKTWGLKMAESNSIVCNPIAFKMGWHALFGEQAGEDLAKILFEQVSEQFSYKENSWVLYTSTLIKCKPSAEWNMKSCEALLYACFHLINDMKNYGKRNGGMSDFFKKAVTSLKQVGNSVDIDKVITITAHIFPIINKKSGSSGLMSDDHTSRLAWMMESCSVVTLQSVTDEQKIASFVAKMMKKQ